MRIFSFERRGMQALPLPLFQALPSGSAVFCKGNSHSFLDRDEEFLGRFRLSYWRSHWSDGGRVWLSRSFLEIVSEPFPVHFVRECRDGWSARQRGEGWQAWEASWRGSGDSSPHRLTQTPSFQSHLRWKEKSPGWFEVPFGFPLWKRRGALQKQYFLDEGCRTGAGQNKPSSHPSLKGPHLLQNREPQPGSSEG